MRLAIKLMAVFFCVMLVVTGIFGYLAVKREEQIFAERARSEVERLAAAMEPSLRGVWQTHGAERAAQLLREMPIQRYSMRVRWVWFDAPRTDPHGPVAPLERWEPRSVGQVITISEATPGGVRNLYAYRPLDVDASRPGGLEFAYPLAQLQQAKRATIMQTFQLFATLVLVTGLTVIIAGVTMVGKPLRQLIDKTRHIAGGDLDNPLKLDTGDELSELADSLNELCTRLSASQAQVRTETTARIAALDQLRHADRLRTVGRLASGIAHELGTPLNVISGRAGLIAEQQLPPERIVESATTIKRESERMTKIIRQLLDYARRGEPHRTRVDIAPIVQQTVDLLAPLAGGRQIEIVPTLSNESAIVYVDVGQIQQVLTNILVNAVQASPADGSIEVAISQTSGDDHEGNWICVAIHDEGEGISEEHQQQIFDPFFTTKEVGEGTGLGLSIAYRIIEEHGGRIEVQSEPGKGSIFKVLIPA